MKSIYRKYFATIALIWTGCFVLSFFAYMLVLTPQKKSRKQVEKNFAEKKQTYESAQKAARAETKLKLSEQIEQLRSGLEDFVIGFGDLADLIFDISKIASDKQVGSFSIKTRDSRAGSAIPNCDHISESYINISFTAGFNQFASFLNALERHRPVVFIDRFAITRSAQDNLGHRVTMNLAVFVRKQDQG